MQAAPDQIQLHLESAQQLMQSIQTEINEVKNPWQTQGRQETLNAYTASYNSLVATYNHYIAHRMDPSPLLTQTTDLQTNLENLRMRLQGDIRRASERLSPSYKRPPWLPQSERREWLAFTPAHGFRPGAYSVHMPSVWYQKRFARIWSCDATFDNGQSMTVAVKEMKPIVPVPFPQFSPALKERTMREFRLLESLNHPNVVKIIGCNQWIDTAVLITPWYGNGEVMTYMRGVSPFEQGKTALRLVKEIADGLNYLHRHEVCHGDIRPDNVMINATGSAVIIDFGFATYKNGTHAQKGFVLTPEMQQMTRGELRYTAVELESGLSSSKEGDVYSFGCVAYEIISGQLPYKNCPLQFPYSVLQARLLHNQPPASRNDNTIHHKSPLWDILESCWNVEPSHRPDMAKVVKWLTKL